MIRTEAVMGTLVTIETARADTAEAIDCAFDWFFAIEQCCTRFDPSSELMRLTSQIGIAVPAGAILFETVRFALLVAEETGGAFDPTVGHQMEARGFNREHHSGEIISTPIERQTGISFRDVAIDIERQTITLLRPLILDLGAIAKGLAIDTAARELQPFADFTIDAGGDLYLGGRNAAGDPWNVGIRHPRRANTFIDSFPVSNQAVCTSGDYEQADHILDPRSGLPANTVASATVIAPTAMLADALSTAAFVLGPEQGIALLERLGVEGHIVTPDLACFETRGLRHAA